MTPAHDTPAASQPQASQVPAPTGVDPVEAAPASLWTALCAAESDAIAARRQQLLGDGVSSNPAEAKLPRVGLALSGGGVRSATFALGLMRGLAQGGSPRTAGTPAPPAQKTLAEGGLLGRLDYLSTVSGGGYTGAMYGRLVATYGLVRAQALMARPASPVLDWLRRNGRYLTPAGSRDIGIAVVTYLRAWLAIHTEFMFASILLGLVVVAPHLWQHSVQVLNPQGWERWQTPWWPLSLAFWAALAPGLIAGYWAARDAPDPAATGVVTGWRDAAFLLAVAVGAFFWTRALQAGGALDPLRRSLNLPGVGVLALASLVLGQLAAMAWMAASRSPHAFKVARLRNGLTRALRLVLLGSLTLAGLGALDRLSWWLLEEFQTGNAWLWSGLGAGGVVVVVLRALAQPLQQLAARSESHAREWLPRLVNLASVFGLLALVTAWLVLLQWFVFAPDTFSALRGVPPLLRASLLAALWLAWIVLTAGNAQMPNASSLHSFYRARITRAYLGVGNRERSLDDDAAGSRADVTRVIEGDDTRLHNYRPEGNGGPIHLVNTCLNQTRDDKSGLYNADRKGTAVTASWRGFEVGPHDFVPMQPGHDAGTLGRWIAVSGAASSSGAGAYTSRGMALLVYFLGVRLGYWMQSPRAPVAPGLLAGLVRLAWRALPKPLMLASEASAAFYGVKRPWWFLSDGGHFENSGVYPLLKREVGFIILSDAGRDAHYEFGDIENLVRKARIDFGAEIDFYSRDEAAGLFSLGSTELTVLSPEDMANNHSCRGVLLARIRYRERPGPAGADGLAGKPFRPEATLLVVKPNLHDALDLDLLAYAQKHPGFPHESTGDQSFDEAQWESYHRLGEDFGRALNDSWLSQVPGWRSPARHAIRVAARLGAGPRPVGEALTDQPLWRRGARAAAIGTTLGLGASGTLLLSLWQVQDQLQRNRTDEQTQARQLFTEVSQGLQSFRGACPQVPEHVVAQAVEMLRLRGSPVLRPFEQAGLDRLAERIGEECGQPVEPRAECQAASDRIQKDLCTEVKPHAVSTAMNYWHPGASAQDQQRDSRKVLHAVAARFPVLGTAYLRQPAGMPTQAGLDADSAVTASGAPPPPPPPVSSVPPAAAGVPVAALASLAPCQRAAGERTTLYVQIYDEASRLPASSLRQSLQASVASPLIVAPIDNVIRSAELRQQRKPVPWPKPTFVLHDPASRDCARAISGYIGAPWVLPGAEDPVWLRNLPGSLMARPGVIELWLPPLEAKPF